MERLPVGRPSAEVGNGERAMATIPSQQARPTADEICHRALHALQRLYCLTDAGEPDLSANVTFTVGRVMLLRFAAGNRGPVASDRRTAVIARIEAAERVTDPRTAEAWFTTFVEGVLCLLEGGAPGYPTPIGRLDLAAIGGTRPGERAWLGPGRRTRRDPGSQALGDRPGRR